MLAALKDTLRVGCDVFSNIQDNKVKYTLFRRDGTDVLPEPIRDDDMLGCCASRFQSLRHLMKNDIWTKVAPWFGDQLEKLRKEDNIFLAVIIPLSLIDLAKAIAALESVMGQEQEQERAYDEMHFGAMGVLYHLYAFGLKNVGTMIPLRTDFVDALLKTWILRFCAANSLDASFRSIESVKTDLLLQRIDYFNNWHNYTMENELGKAHKSLTCFATSDFSPRDSIDARWNATKPVIDCLYGNDVGVVISPESYGAVKLTASRTDYKYVDNVPNGSSLYLVAGDEIAFYTQAYGRLQFKIKEIMEVHGGGGERAH
jgi:hypothetical protein